MPRSPALHLCFFSVPPSPQDSIPGPFSPPSTPARPPPTPPPHPPPSLLHYTHPLRIPCRFTALKCIRGNFPGGLVVRAPELSLQGVLVQSLAGELRSCMRSSTTNPPQNKQIEHIRSYQFPNNIHPHYLWILYLNLPTCYNPFAAPGSILGMLLCSSVDLPRVARTWRCLQRSLPAWAHAAALRPPVSPLTLSAAWFSWPSYCHIFPHFCASR